LKDFLKEYHGAFIVISHDFDFLNQVTNCIIDIEFSQIKKYTGNFDQFMQLKMQNRETYQQTYSSQQRTIAKLEDYISRNSARASTARMAQSRQKQLDRIDVLPPAQTLPKPHFNLVSTNPPNGTVLVISKLLIGYDSPLLPEFNLKIEAGEKIVISGFNGIGKSTLMKTIVGQIPQLGGSYE
jgi:ATPase subunit of ABC transporter with duplicated ATPase domains